MSERTNKQNNTNGNEINPHMPQYIIKPPWYLNQTENSLKHQKAQVEVTKAPISNYTLKGFAEESVYKFRKGACENCGALTHKLKECLERPRKRGAKWSGKDFSKDEFIYEVPLDFEGKRDRWNGYDPNSFSRIMHEYQRLEDAKKKLKQEELQNITDENMKKKKMRDEDLDESVSSEDENKLLVNDIPNEFKDAVNLNIMSMSNTGEINESTSNINEVTDEDVMAYLVEMRKDSTKNINDIPKKILYKMCVSKSLHVGSDYSKYLINLALNSAYYDGKSRSMRENPNPGCQEIHSFKGDNYIRNTGDTLKLIELENFIKEANDKNRDLNLNNIAMPSQAELFHRYLQNTKDRYKSAELKKVISKYGGEEHLNIPQEVKEILTLSPDENQNPEENPNAHSMVKSMYPEDVFVNNHSSVWGSFYHDKFGWGYKCCLSFEKTSWCKGEVSYKENLKLIQSYEKNLKEEKNKEKEVQRQKEEKLRQRNLQEEKDGIFNDMFDRMEKYEQTGRIEFKKDKEFLQKKVGRNEI
jgi:pre-mRNA-processing factor SLU7